MTSVPTAISASNNSLSAPDRGGSALAEIGQRARLKLSLIRCDNDCQPRAATDERTVDEYAEAMRAGSEFPPVIVVYDGADYWLGDGYHRCAVAEAAGLDEIEAVVYRGDRRDAILRAVSANATPGLRRTNEDKRRAMTTLLEDPSGAPGRTPIARRCAVAQSFVGKARLELSPYLELGEAGRVGLKYVTKHGIVLTMFKIADALARDAVQAILNGRV